MDTLLKPAALLVVLCVLAACSPDPSRDPRANETSGAESAPAAPSTAQPAPVTPPTADDIAPADSNTTLPAATLEEAAPPPEP